MQTNLLQQNIAPLLGIDSLPQDEKELFLADIGDLIMESALVRLMNELSDEAVASIDHYLETEPAPEVFLEHILQHYKKFGKIFEEEVLAFKQEATEIFRT